MTRAELAQLLAMMVRQRRITAEEAAETLRLFDAGELDGALLPLPVAEALQEEDRSRETLLFLVALLASSVSLRQARLVAAGESIALGVRYQVSTQLRREFERRVMQLATQTGSLAQWQAGMGDEVSRYLWRQYAAGVGRPLRAAEAAMLRAWTAEQRVYLARFAMEIGVRQATGNPFSVAYLVNRSLQYGGAGLELWHVGAEADDRSQGWVYDYIAVDDGRTCSPCYYADLDGPYLAGQGPMPGRECKAKGRCRCRRVRRWAPAAWAALSGQALAA